MFLTALNKAYELPDTFDGWHLIVDDFDGDGRQEAYVFAGQPLGDQWYNISVFYVDPNGKITEILKNSRRYGAPQETKSTKDASFASSCFRYKIRSLSASGLHRRMAASIARCMVHIMAEQQSLRSMAAV